jgi:hypothetical protein
MSAVSLKYSLILELNNRMLLEFAFRLLGER